MCVNHCKGWKCNNTSVVDIVEGLTKVVGGILEYTIRVRKL